MSKRKKHNEQDRLRASCKGAFFKCDNGVDLTFHNALGLPVCSGQTIKNISSLAWRWRIEFTFFYKNGETVSESDDVIEKKELKRINQIQDDMYKLRTKAGLEAGAGFKFSHMTWRAKIL